MAQKWYQKASVQTAIVSGVFFLIGVAIPYFFKIPILENKIDLLEKDNSDKTAEIQRLETQLTPFKTIALEKYTGSEQEALQQLAHDIQEIQNKANKLEKQIQKRSISNDQKEILLSRLKAANNKKILITAIMGDQEALQFAHILKDIFIEAGWEVDGIDRAMYLTPMEGLWLTIIEEPAPEEANIIYQAFRMISFSIKGQRNPQQKEPLQLIIGSK
jgi:hypothetical protein